MAHKIYTKTGDRGRTTLIGGTKVNKGSDRLEAYGTIDELNVHIGLCKDLIKDKKCMQVLEVIQDKLFIIGSELACDPFKSTKMSLPDVYESDCAFLEKEIDRMDEVLEPLNAFILPGGHSTVSQVHIARCVCRRAERCCVRLQETEPVPAIIIKYLNRLSDYLFVLARYTAARLKVKEVLWKPKTVV
ncbi:Corrinoid adenosyltransferase [Mycovorax composti]|jgi:ATP:cob(I)alamin adenosyltransferase|uniref:Corrinoid adenosyltransferase n=2 Tax=Chitinophagaceae TaxID=563835 RepID=A0ABZ2ENR0_9BACT